MSKKEIIMEDVPRQCPMCKSPRTVSVTHHGDIWIKCKRCGKRGPKAATLAEAVRKWNGANDRKEA